MVSVVGRCGIDGIVVVVDVDGRAAVVDVTVGVVVVADVWRAVVVEEALRSQGFGGDACMSNGMGKRQSPIDGTRTDLVL